LLYNGSHLNTTGGLVQVNTDGKIPSELIPDGGADLSNYYTKTEIDTTVDTINQAVAEKTDYSYVNGEINTVRNEIPSLTGYATESYVDTKISEIPEPDLSDYVTDSELNTALSGKADKTEIPSLDGYATEAWTKNNTLDGYNGRINIASSDGMLQFNNVNNLMINNCAVNTPGGFAMVEYSGFLKSSLISADEDLAILNTDGFIDFQFSSAKNVLYKCMGNNIKLVSGTNLYHDKKVTLYITAPVVIEFDSSEFEHLNEIPTVIEPCYFNQNNQIYTWKIYKFELEWLGNPTKLAGIFNTNAWFNRASIKFIEKIEINQQNGYSDAQQFFNGVVSGAYPLNGFEIINANDTRYNGKYWNIGIKFFPENGNNYACYKKDDSDYVYLAQNGGNSGFLIKVDPSS
jgi:hypothetical protein